MAALLEIYLKKEVLEKMAKTKQKGISLTVAISDYVNDYGQNVSVYVSQTKEQRENKEQRYYVANGKVFWTDEKIAVAEKPPKNESDENGDLPF